MLLSDMPSYAQMDATVCVPNDLWLQGLLSSNFMGVPFLTLRSSPPGILDAVSNGTCGAAARRPPYHPIRSASQSNALLAASHAVGPAAAPICGSGFAERFL